MKHTVTPERAVKIYESMQCMATIVQLLDIEYQIYLHDTKLTKPQLNQHKKPIKESITAIQHDILGEVSMKDRAYFEFSRVPDIYSVLRFIMFLPEEDLKDTLTQIEQFNQTNKL